MKNKINKPNKSSSNSAFVKITFQFQYFALKCLLLLILMFNFASAANYSHRLSMRFLNFNNDTEQNFFGKGNHVFLYESLIGQKDVKLGINLGFLIEKSYKLGAVSGRKSSEKINMFLMPIELYAEYTPLRRFKFYVEPFVDAGFQGYVLNINESGQKIQNFKNGVFIKPGLRFSKHKKTSIDTTEMFGIHNIFLDFYYSYRPMFKTQGVDLSSWDLGFSIGMQFF